MAGAVVARWLWWRSPTFFPVYIRQSENFAWALPCIVSDGHDAYRLLLGKLAVLFSQYFSD